MTIKDIKDFTLKWEGGNGSKGRNPNDSAARYPCPTKFVDPKDGILKSGWHTVEGVTYRTWVGVFGKNNDLRWWNMSDEDWMMIYRTRFFDRIKGDKFKFMNVAAVVVDGAFLSGAFESIETLQEAINDVNGNKNVTQDGLIGSQTIEAANKIEPKKLIQAYVNRRMKFFNSITDDNTPQEIKNRTFLKGWKNRTNKYLTDFTKGL